MLDIDKNEIIEILKQCDDIIQHYGPIHQYNKLTEEVFELYDAIMASGKNYKNIVSEGADTFIMLIQFYTIDNAFKNEVARKLTRQFERIENDC